ncbi:YciI family protein [Cellulomonas dongxiuzhuiae]|uniref:YCII-related domain-containing protein n=1 Tax=Cellulomonas dongxiuzhuiae TaxID=2819979 RepID=A0ABX8GLB6_9CELL|nr:YciI family protein [Cellulomonas dongxiuzhuiae]MBO3096506.1 hypothetical protein [Cellulomonas dongxiuzhuiae]QWC16899.1 hypothetical protein KKR89_04535 [Cellulomonas dongxiuzhuiae]
MPQYLLIVDFQPGTDPAPMQEWDPADVQAHLDHYGALNDELRANGELTGLVVLDGPDVARVVRSDGRAGTTVTEGPFTEFSEWVAGFQVVDVASLDRALEIAARVSAAPGRGGVPLGQPVQVRRVLDDGPSDAEAMTRWLRDTARGDGEAGAAGRPNG